MASATQQRQQPLESGHPVERDHLAELHKIPGAGDGVNFPKGHRLSLDSAMIQHQMNATRLSNRNNRQKDSVPINKLASDVNGLHLPAGGQTKVKSPMTALRPKTNQSDARAKSPAAKKDNKSRLLCEESHRDMRGRSMSAPKIYPPKLIISRDRSGSAQVAGPSFKCRDDRKLWLDPSAATGSLSVPDSPNTSPPLPRIVGKRLDSTAEAPDSEAEDY